MSDETTQNAFTIESHGDLLVVIVSSALESFEADMLDGASALLIEPIRHNDSPQVLFDLGLVRSFGSAFLALLIRCWKHVAKQGGQMSLCGVSEQVRELLKITSLDTVWPIYATRSEAVEALQSD